MNKVTTLLCVIFIVNLIPNACCALDADIDRSGKVNFDDLSILADEWLIQDNNAPGLKSIYIVAPSTASIEQKQLADYVCDGIDDQVQIQAAIDTLPATGGSVYLLAGTYNVRDEILIDANNVHLCGQQGSKLKLQQAASTLAIPVSAGQVSSITVADATDFLIGQTIKIGDGITFETRSITDIDCNVLTLGNGIYPCETGNFAIGYATEVNVVSVFDIIRVGNITTNISRVTISDLYLDGNIGSLTIVEGTGEYQNDYYLNGIRNLSADHCTIKNCYINDVTYNGILSHYRHSDDFRALENTIITTSTRSQSRGIAMESASHFWQIKGNYCSNPTASSAMGNSKGIYFSGGTDPTCGVITNNYIRGWYDGIRSFGDSENVLITNNHIDKPANCGMDIRDGTCISITGNWVLRAGYYAICTRQVTNGFVCHNNIIVDANQCGIKDYGGSENIIANNIIKGNGNVAEALYCTSADCFIGDNILPDSYSYYQKAEVVRYTKSLELYRPSSLDCRLRTIYAYLPDGLYIGQIKTIVMTNATHIATVEVIHCDQGDGHTYTFNAVGEMLYLMWTGEEWVEIKKTCT